MARLRKLKIFLFAVAVIITLWNYFLRGFIKIPYLSDLGQMTVYIVSGVVFIIWIITVYSTRY